MFTRPCVFACLHLSLSLSRSLGRSLSRSLSLPIQLCMYIYINICILLHTQCSFYVCVHIKYPVVLSEHNPVVLLFWGDFGGFFATTVFVVQEEVYMIEVIVVGKRGR